MVKTKETGRMGSFSNLAGVKVLPKPFMNDQIDLAILDKPIDYVLRFLERLSKCWIQEAAFRPLLSIFS
ncbi:MAG: hypothetical protein IPP46_06100 [Bacteroidetes bacterium]|nr:hypothetical protein [Bacteroidota bacterium]